MSEQSSQAEKPAANGGFGVVVDVVAGTQHACALHASGTVSCWGRNHVGQLGDGLTSDRSWAAPVDGLTDATKIVAGG